jgi:hypothetical protein
MQSPVICGRTSLFSPSERVAPTSAATVTARAQGSVCEVVK